MMEKIIDLTFATLYRVCRIFPAFLESNYTKDVFQHLFEIDPMKILCIIS